MSNYLGPITNYLKSYLPRQPAIVRPKQPPVIPAEIKPPALEVPSQPKPIAATVVQPKVETEEEKLAKQQKAFEKFMDECSVPLDIMSELNKMDLTRPVVNSMVLQSKGDRVTYRFNTDAESEKYYTDMVTLRQFMEYFKDKPLDYSNFGPWELFRMITAKAWEGTEQQQKLVKALEHYVLNAPEEILRHERRSPNVFLTSVTYPLFFDNVNYSEYTEEQKRNVFKSLYLTLLIDPSFAEYLIKEKNEEPAKVHARISWAVEELVDRTTRSELPFACHFTGNSRLDQDNSDVAKLAAFCGGIGNPFPSKTLSEKAAKAFNTESSYLDKFHSIFKNQLAIVEASKELQKVVLESDVTAEDKARLSEYLSNHASYGYAPSRYNSMGYCINFRGLDKNSIDRLSDILAKNPHLLKAVWWEDIAKISDKFSAEQIRTALLVQIELAKSFSGSLHGEITKEDLSKLEAKIPKSDSSIWWNISYSTPKEKSPY